MDIEIEIEIEVEVEMVYSLGPHACSFTLSIGAITVSLNQVACRVV